MRPLLAKNQGVFVQSEMSSVYGYTSGLTNGANFEPLTTSFGATGPTKRPSFGLKLPFWRPMTSSTDPDYLYVFENEFIS